MRPPSKRRQAVLAQDKEIVMIIYRHSCQRWGRDVVDAHLTHLWDLRCMWGIQGILPFGETSFTTLGEMLWVAEELCGLGRKNLALCSESVRPDGIQE